MALGDKWPTKPGMTVRVAVGRAGLAKAKFGAGRRGRYAPVDRGRAVIALPAWGGIRAGAGRAQSGREWQGASTVGCGPRRPCKGQVRGRAQGLVCICGQGPCCERAARLERYQGGRRQGRPGREWHRDISTDDCQSPLALQRSRPGGLAQGLACICGQGARCDRAARLGRYQRVRSQGRSSRVWHGNVRARRLGLEGARAGRGCRRAVFVGRGH